MSNNMNKQLFKQFLTNLAKKPKRTDAEIREAHLRDNLGVTGRKKMKDKELQKAGKVEKPSILSPSPSAPPSQDAAQEDQSRRRRRSSIEDILPGALLVFGRRGNRGKSPQRQASPLPAVHPMQSLLQRKGLTDKLTNIAKKK